MSKKYTVVLVLAAIIASCVGNQVFYKENSEHSFVKMNPDTVSFIALDTVVDSDFDGSPQKEHPVPTTQNDVDLDDDSFAYLINNSLKNSDATSTIITDTISNEKTAPKRKKAQDRTQDMKIKGETRVVLPVTDLNTGAKTKEIKVLKIEINHDYLKNMKKRAESIDANNNADEDYSPTSPVKLAANDFEFNLGMNGVPVFDQGSAGTCATFASTAAIDAKLMNGDFISQQCLLELGSHLAVDAAASFSYEYSGWEGVDSSRAILSRIKKYGIVDKNTCPRPYVSTIQNHIMSPNQYAGLRYDWGNTNIDWKLLNANDVDLAKKALNDGHRLIIGTLVDIYRLAGAPINSARTGLWEIPQNMSATEYYKSLQMDNLLAGHAVIITGFDDQRKLFKIRNSWGITAGDKGEYYMSYDYYKLMNMETIEILD